MILPRRSGSGQLISSRGVREDAHHLLVEGPVVERGERGVDTWEMPENRGMSLAMRSSIGAPETARITTGIRLRRH